MINPYYDDNDIEEFYKALTPKEIVKSNKFNSLTLAESDKILGKTAFGFKSIDEVNKLGESIDYALSNHDTSALSESGIYDIPAIIGAMLGYLTGKYSLQYKIILSQAKEINEMYTKIEALLKSNKVIRFQHRKDPISTTFSDVYLMKKGSNKKYYLTISQLIFDPAGVTNTIEQQIQAMQQDQTSQKTFATNAVNDFKDRYVKVIDYYYPELTGYYPVFVTTAYNKAPLEKVINVQKNNFAVSYGNIYAYNYVLSVQAVYLSALQQAYATLQSRYKTDKNAMIIVNGIFDYCLELVNRSMKFNTDCMNQVQKSYTNNYNELVKIYDYLKQFA